MRRRLVVAGPALILAAVAAAGLGFGPTQVVLGLVVISPLLAASYLNQAVTGAYAVAAVVAAVLLGVFDEQYTAPSWPAQAVRLAAVAVGGVLAVVTCGKRLRREDRMRAMAAATARAENDARRVQEAANLAEELQRSLLTVPPRHDDLDIEVRYVPATRHVKIGGDWYDAFGIAGGRTVLVVGDVAGHDRVAAATMAAIRQMLRGIMVTAGGSPAQVLATLDGALRQLEPGVLASVVLVQVAPPQGAGVLPVCWSNAGHPPPVVVRAGGGTEVLERDPDPLLGLAARVPRRDHEAWLAAGDCLLLYTDGLVERRFAVIDDGIDRLRERATAAVDRPLADVCDDLMAHLAGTSRNDDAALLAARSRVAVRAWSEAVPGVRAPLLAGEGAPP